MFIIMAILVNSSQNKLYLNRNWAKSNGNELLTQLHVKAANHLPADPLVNSTGSTNTLGSVMSVENDSSGRINVAHTSTGFAIPSRKIASERIRATRMQNQPQEIL